MIFCQNTTIQDIVLIALTILVGRVVNSSCSWEYTPIQAHIRVNVLIWIISYERALSDSSRGCWAVYTTYTFLSTITHMRANVNFIFIIFVENILHRVLISKNLLFLRHNLPISNPFLMTLNIFIFIYLFETPSFLLLAELSGQQVHHATHQ